MFYPFFIPKFDKESRKLLANGKCNEVIELLKPISIKEMENNTDVWRANLHMSVAYYYLQDKQKSKQHLEKALTLTTSQEGVDRIKATLKSLP